MSLPIVAFIGYGGFLTVTFGWTTLRARRSSGEGRWRRPRSPTDAIGEAACLVACLLSIAAGPLALGGLARGPAVGGEPARGVLAVALVASGLAMAVWAQRHLGDHWRAGVEASSSLVVTGPFALVRNPFYLGCVLASAAVAVAVPSAVAAGGLLLHFVAAELIVRAVEEPLLARAHGAAYCSYAARTGRFLPRRARAG